MSVAVDDGVCRDPASSPRSTGQWVPTAVTGRHTGSRQGRGMEVAQDVHDPSDAQQPSAFHGTNRQELINIEI